MTLFPKSDVRPRLSRAVEEFYLPGGRRGTKMQTIPSLLRADPCLEGSREAWYAKH